MTKRLKGHSPSPELEAIKRQDLRELLVRDFKLEFNQNNRAICPFHNDHDPSLSVFKGKDGNWRWNCFGCQEQGDYFDFKAKMEGRDVSEILKELAPITGRHPKQSQGEPIAIYPYYDESGTPLYRKRKFDSESYLTDRYESGKWTPGLNGTRRVLYNLPALADASQVFLLEGEKDCETLKALGFVATTMGSIHQWKADFAQHFTGKDVVICFDVGNDDEAKKAGNDISGVAKSVRILSLPGLTEREQDITNWFEQMGEVTAEEKKQRLLDVVAGTSPFVPELSEPEVIHSSRSLTLSEFLQKDIPPRDIFMEFWVERECLTILAGHQKAGKSLLTANLGLSLAVGRDFLGFKIQRPRRVLYVQQEISLSAMLERLHKMIGQNASQGLNNFLIENTTGDPLKLTKRDGIERLKRFLESDRPDLLILDPFSTLHEKDENCTPEMSAVIEQILRLKQEFKIGVLLIHHFGKPTVVERKGSHRLRGSTTIGDRADSIIMLDRFTEGKRAEFQPNGNLGRLSFTLRNDADPGDVIIRFDPETLWFRKASPVIGLGRKIPATAILEAVEAYGGEIKQAELLEALIGKGFGSRGTVLKAITEAEASGLVLPVRLAKKGGPVLLKANGGQR